MAKQRDVNDAAAESPGDGFRREVDARTAAAIRRELFNVGCRNGDELYLEYGENYRPAIIRGLLREGETMNVVSSSKVGKSCLVYSLAFAAAGGTAWLDPQWWCTRGPVVIIDNELHPETLSARMESLRKHLGLPVEIRQNIIVIALRGQWRPIADLEPLIKLIANLNPVLLVLDSLYRFLPEGVSENDNAEIAKVYNTVDRFAAILEHTAIVIVHHASKGGQGEKSVLDVGSGAGSFSRAPDTHFVLREHDEEGCYVAEARCRSWPTPKPITLRWEFPLWKSTAHDPDKLKGKRCVTVRGPDELDDAAFVSYLAPVPRSSREKWSRIAVRALVDGVVLRYGLDGLSHQDGPKDCGLFMAEFGGRGSGLKFWLKGS